VCFQLLSDLEHVAHNVDDENNPLQCRMKAVASELNGIVQSHLKVDWLLLSIFFI
jgi:hypothetical protein